MNCKICNADSGQDSYCKGCRAHIGKISKNVAKKEVGKDSIHADIVKMLSEMSKTHAFSWYKKDQGYYSQNGVSDFSITFPVSVPDCWHGIHIACEVKAGKNKLSALQAEYLKNHIIYGCGIGIVVRSADELKSVIFAIDDISDRLARRAAYQDCHEVLARSWDEIWGTLEKVKTVKGAKDRVHSVRHHDAR